MQNYENLIRYLKENNAPLREFDEDTIRESIDKCRFIIDEVDPDEKDEFASSCIYEKDTDTVFYFRFINENTDMYTVYGFSIAGEHKPAIYQLEDGEEHFLDLVSAFERFGVHDYNSSPTDDVEGIGYHSYEVNPERYEVLMNSWRMAFACLFDDESLGPVVNLGMHHNEDDSHPLHQADDAQILSIIQEKMRQIKPSKPTL